MTHARFSLRASAAMPGEFHWVHVGAFNWRGNFYTGEVATGKRLQKWVLVN